MACLLCLALAGTTAAAAQDAAASCRDQASLAERTLGLPPGLLLAVGRVESGRDDPASHDVLPWPWSVNDEGEDHVFNSAFNAIAYVVAARARGSRSIDVGCFQVNLQYHPDAFAGLADAFDPAANARVAGQFLTELHGRSGSWETAVELYHSATPWRGAAYRDLVLARWTEASLTPPGAASPAPMRTATAATPMVAMPRNAAPAGTRTMRVQYPTGMVERALPARVGRLPRVNVPSDHVGR